MWSAAAYVRQDEDRPAWVRDLRMPAVGAAAWAGGLAAALLPTGGVCLLAGAAAGGWLLAWSSRRAGAVGAGRAATGGAGLLLAAGAWLLVAVAVGSSALLRDAGIAAGPVAAL